MLPLASTSCAPYAWNSAPTQSTESVVCPNPRPKGLPPLKHFSAADRKVSQVHWSCNALSGLPPAPGYILTTSSPAYFLSRSIRPQGPLIWLPFVAGTATQWPSTLPRYSTTCLLYTSPSPRD